MIDLELQELVNNHIYLNAKYRYASPANKWPDDIYLYLKKHFWQIYKTNVFKRLNKKVGVMGQKEIDVLKYCFQWTICDPNFNGDLSKGLMLVSKQGFGKDILLNTIVDFYSEYNFKLRESTYFDFATEWFNSSPSMFKMPLKISDVYPIPKMKREKESMPFLELLDYREQNFLMRGLLVSTNYKPEVLQEIMEKEQVEKRLHERIKACFNVVLITGTESKREDNTVKI
jgi:hypothetical protein